ncbi:MAG: sugar ABC transporter permease [Cellulomonadaceae bacterium]|jgi:raffinose/stachyose/melibiose transport system permease protein|nr:sugar ABC transporter permease [Cellulomonadaceae bacterium]
MRVSKALEKWFPLFALPTTAAFILAFGIPFILGFYMSFNKFPRVFRLDSRTFQNMHWVGLDNYKAALQDGSFLHAFVFTALFTVVSVILVNVIAFTLAMLLTKAIAGRNIYRAVFFIPNLIGGIVLGFVWQNILNAILQWTVGRDITYSATYGFIGLVIVINWQMIGYMMIIYIAGIQNIPGEVVEAAAIDGAGWWVKLTKVTLPMVASSITICVFLTLANCFKLFDQNLSLTGGAPGDNTEMLALNIFRDFENAPTQSVGQAKAVIFFILVALISFIQLRATRSQEVDG